MSVEPSTIVPAAPEPMADADPLIGAHIDRRYRIERVHGQGGMATVYAGVHRELGLSVAIKVLDGVLSTDPEAVRLFLAEARTASLLSHPNIVAIFDVGCLPDGRPFLVMPMLDGSDLATLLLREGPQTPQRVASLLEGVGAALDLIHERGLLHRDIKPENLMHVRNNARPNNVIVLDFGIASARLPEMRKQLVDWCGTPDFMPPETIAGEATDHRGDVYALATVAFELLTGCLPFEGEDLSDLFHSKLHEQPRSLSRAAGVPFCAELEAVLAAGLATDPQRRPSSAGELVRGLTEAAAVAVDQAPKAPAVPRAVRRSTLVGSGSALEPLAPVQEKRSQGIQPRRRTQVGVSSFAPEQSAPLPVVAPMPQARRAAVAAPQRPAPERRPPQQRPAMRTAGPRTLDSAPPPPAGTAPAEPIAASLASPSPHIADPKVAVRAVDAPAAASVEADAATSFEPPPVALDGEGALPLVDAAPRSSVWDMVPDSIGPPPAIDDELFDPALERILRARGATRRLAYGGLSAAAVLALIVWTQQRSPVAKQPDVAVHAATAEKPSTARATEPAEPSKSDTAKPEPTSSALRAAEPKPEAANGALPAATAPASDAAATIAALRLAPPTPTVLAPVPRQQKPEPSTPSPARTVLAPIPRRQKPEPSTASPARGAFSRAAAKTRSSRGSDPAPPVLVIRPSDDDPEPSRPAPTPTMSRTARAEDLTRDATDAMLRGDLEEATALYARALKADVSYAPAWRGKGLVLERTGQRREAAAAFKAFLRLQPNGAAAQAIERRLQALEMP